MTAQALNADLIGVAGGRWQLQTPALVIDLDAMERNIARMADHARRHDIALRPHAKTHKCSQIAKLQMEAGAPGICVAKLGEAEALADAGIDSILITSPVVTARGIARLMALNGRVRELMAVCDNPEIAMALARAARECGMRLKVLVDIDPGMGRTGVAFGEPALALVQQIAHSDDLEFAGLQCYAGNLQHLESPNERRDASLSVMRRLADLRDALTARGLQPKILTGAGTGTFDIDPDARTLTELQVGSYVFMDRQYNAVWQKPGERAPFETSLFVQTTVISANRDGLATTDGGFKAFATDAGPPLIASGAPEDASYFFFGDEHGGVRYDPGKQALRPDDVLTCVVPHCDPTVNLYDCYQAVRRGVLEAVWPIEARGRGA
jgi:D-serine deaminase-like pyridoxal phosphate-dependent protein